MEGNGNQVSKQWLEAVGDGNHALVESLLFEHYHLINAMTEYGDSALHVAAQNGRTDMVALLLEIAPSLSLEVNISGWTSLHDAASRGHGEVVAQLLAAGSYVHAATLLLETPLHFAAQQGHGGVVAQLLSADARICDAKNYLSDTALHGAAENGHLEVVEQLLAANPLLIEAKNQCGWTALQVAASNGHTRIADMLLEINPSFAFVVDNQSNTLLHLACRTCGVEFVEKLWRLHPDALRKTDFYGKTPFQVAIETGHIAAIELFQWTDLTVDEIIRSFTSFRDGPLHLPLLELQCECLFVDYLNRDLTQIVFQYLDEALIPSSSSSSGRKRKAGEDLPVA